MLAASFGCRVLGYPVLITCLLTYCQDGCVAALAYWATGFGLGLGTGGNPFLGKSYFFLIGYEDNLVYFFFFYVFAGTTATIVSGAVAER